MLIISVGMASAAPYIYVTNQNTNSVTVLDAADDTVISVINDVCNTPVVVAFSPDWKKAYVPDIHGTISR